MVYYEVKRGLLAVEATTKAREFDRLCQEFGIGDMDIRVWDEAARLYALHRKSGRPAEDADLLIAAFSIINGCTLVTHNIGHFKNMDSIQIEDWAD
jgi:tRNA(fMet)-specific endonuclease VapC